tara:strand:+ start:198 stop:578 length:381 start_codon:yes stop_codon:yes gene_type:complete
MSLLFTILVFLLAISIIFHSVNDKTLEVSRHTNNLNNDMIFAVLKAFQTIEAETRQDLQYLINAEMITKTEIQKAADEILISTGEFTIDPLDIDPRDFDRLVRLHDQILKDSSDLQIRYIIHTLFK